MSIVLGTARPAQTHPTECPEVPPTELADLLLAGTDGAREAAWAEFVERYSRLLLRVAFHFAPGYDDAMDRYAFMLDELRRDGYRRLHRFSADGRGRFSTWLVVVARRLCLDHHRSRYGRTRTDTAPAPRHAAERAQRRRLADLAGAAEDVARCSAVETPDPGDDLSDAERRQALARAFGELEPRDQLLLRLRFKEELSAREIAEFLRMPTPFHVYRRLRTLLGTLRGRLVGQGVEA